MSTDSWKDRKMASLYTLLVLCLMASVQCQLPTKCCPSKWQAIATVVESINEEYMIFSYMYYDYDVKTVALQFMAIKPGSQPVKSFRVIQDYGNKIEYNVTEQGTCETTPLQREMISPCPYDNNGNFTTVASSYVGTNETGVNYEAVRFTTDQLSVTIALADCVPILEGIKGSNGGVSRALFFSEYKTPIIDRSAFQIPSNCQVKSSQTPAVDNKIVG